jgi:ABC-type histidine transport system ATPase subunit
VAVSLPEEEFLALTQGNVAVFPGSGKGFLIRCVKELGTPSAELLGTYAEVVLVKDVEESLAFQAAARQTGRKWSEHAAGASR